MAEYSEEGILAIAIHPGSVPTEGSFNMQEDEEWRKIFTDSPELAGDFVVWLTKERRTWLNGRFVDCTWDVKELEEKKEDIVKNDKLKVRLVV